MPLALALAPFLAAEEFEVTLQLVPYDRPDTTLDKLEKKEDIINPVATHRGVEMQRVGVRMVTYARNIRLDGQPVFERYYEKKYVGRAPVAKARLAPGEHRIWPGEHVFVVADDGTLATEDEELRAEGNTVRVKLYPVTLRAFTADPDQGTAKRIDKTVPLPQLTIRDAETYDARMAELDRRKAAGDTSTRGVPELLELLPEFDDFDPLTLWLTANTKGKGYLIHPMGLTFHLGPEGIVPGAGEGREVAGVRVQENVVDVPLYGFHVKGEPGAEALIQGVQKFSFTERATDARTTLYPRFEPYAFRVADLGPAIEIDSDLRSLPLKSFRVDLADRIKGYRRGLVVELARGHLTPGEELEIRVRGLDPVPALEAAAPGRTAADQAQSAHAAIDQVRGGLRNLLQKLGQVAAAAGKGPEEIAKASETTDDLAGKLAELETEWSKAVVSAHRCAGAADAGVAAMNTLKAQDASDRLAQAAGAARELGANLDTTARGIRTARTELEGMLKALAAVLEKPDDSAGGEKAKASVAKTLEAFSNIQNQAGQASNGAKALGDGLRDGQALIADAVANMNGLASAGTFGQIQAYGSTDWQDVTLNPSADGRARVIVPEVPNALYRLRLGLRPGAGRAGPIFTEQWVTIAKRQSLGVGLFTPRGRDAFYRGESFWIGLGVLAVGESIASGTPVAVKLTRDDWSVPLLARKTDALIQGQETFVIRVTSDVSQALAAGRYTVEATAGGQTARPLSLDIVDPTPRTHFTNLLVGKYNAFNKLYQSVLSNQEDAEMVAREIVDAGFNAFKGMSYDMHRVYRANTEIERIVATRPELGPWEAYYQPSGRDQFLNAAVRNNLRFYENIFTYNDTSLPRHPGIVDACERYIGLEVASMRHSPAFKGVCLYDEIYGRSLIDPTGIVAAFDKACEVTYRERHPGLTSGLATKALDRFAGRPVGQRRYEDLEKFRTWPAHQDRDWRILSERATRAVKDLMPYSENFTLQRFWGGNGGNLATNGTPYDVFAPLEVAACVMYKDGGTGDRPVFAPMQADVLRSRDDITVWTQIHGFGCPGTYRAHYMRQAFFGLSQKIEGLTFFTVPWTPKSPSQTDNRDTIRDIAGQLTTPYGDLFVSLEKGYKKVAIYYSRIADYLTLRKPNEMRYTAEGLWVACMRAGFPADFLYDPQILEGKGLEYEVIFVPGFHFEDECPPEMLKALQRLVDAGKVLAVERSSKLPVEGIKRLDSELDEYDDKLGGAFPRYVDFESEMVWDRTEETTPLVRAFLAKHTKPAAEHNLLVGPDWLKRGQAEYLILPNFAYTEFTGLYKTLYQAPDTPRLRFPKRPPVCYDVLEMERAELKTDGEWMELQADFRAYPGKLFAFLPKEIARLDLSASPEVKGGHCLNYRIAVLDSTDNVIDGSFPIHIILTSPVGEVVHQVFRAAAPEYRGVFAVPANVRDGDWKLRARELISGRVAEMTVRVTPGALPAVELEDRKVWISDAANARGFLSEKQPAVIALDDGQDWVKGEAAELAKALTQAGREVLVKPVSSLIRLPGPFDRDQPEIDGTRLWRGDVVRPGVFVDAPVILLGKRNENRLIDAILTREVLDHPITDSFPGPGKAVVAWSRRMFSNEHDAVSVLANDESGLREGIKALLSLGGATAAAAPESPVARVEPDPNAELVAAETHARAPSSFRDVISWEDWVRDIDIDERSGRILVGTFGYGDNVFCFDPNGKLLWKKFLPEHNVYLVRWYDEGRRILALTGRGFYAFLLDPQNGTVLKKFRATEWPNYHGGFNAYQEGAVNTELGVVFNPPLRQILTRGKTAILAIDYDGNRMWLHDRAEAVTSYISEAVQASAAEFGLNAMVGNIALKRDGTKLVYSEMRVVGSTVVNKQIVKVWGHRPQILDARTGSVLLENEEDPGRKTSAWGWSVSWPGDSETPRIHTDDLSMPLLPDGKRGPVSDEPRSNLKDGGVLKRDLSRVERFSTGGQARWRIEGKRVWIPHLDRLNAAETRLYRCDRDGLVRGLDMQTGKTLWERKLPFNARLEPAGDDLIAGCSDGTLVRFDASGNERWRLRVRDLKELPASNYPEYVRKARRRDPDSTHEFYPVGQDRPGEYDGTLRFGVEQIENGGCETRSAWKSGKGEVNYASPGHSGRAAIVLEPGNLVQQRLERRVVPSATYLLEFFYKVEGDETHVIAGALLAGDQKESLTGSRLGARPGQWTFARIAVRTLAETEGLTMGFEAEGGPVAIDDVSFRPVRFPSANLLANSELSAVEPTFVHDLRVQYDKIPRSLREKLMKQNHVAAFLQGVPSTAVIYTQEQAYLHNGRLDDLGKIWTYQPDFVGFSAVLTKPAHVSHLVLYLHNGWPETVYQTISILANNMETKIPEQVALVRGNRRRFIVVHFPKPVFTDAIKIIPGPHRSHTESLTEVELYGPLGGLQVGEKSFPDDPDGWPMFMGSPSHVPGKLPSDLVGEYELRPSHVRAWFPCLDSGMTVGQSVFTFADPGGVVRSAVIPKDRGEKSFLTNGPSWSLATVTPTTTPARYAGRLLAGSADYRMHAVADNGTRLWNFKTGGRIYSSPLPSGDDVYFGSDDGSLYKVDVDSGTLIWEFKTGDKVRSAPALADRRVHFASWDGSLYCVDAESGKEVWKASLAPYTRSSPAVSSGRVYLGDESGAALAFEAANGKPVWRHELGGQVSTGPVVAPDGVSFFSDQGLAALVALDGAVRWKRDLGTRVTGQPIATQTQLIVPTANGLLVLRRADGKRDERFVAPGELGRVNSVLKYQEHLCISTGHFYTNYGHPPRTYAMCASGILLWSPRIADQEGKK